MSIKTNYEETMTLLSESEIFDCKDNKQLDVIKKKGSSTDATDLAYITGYCSKNDGLPFYAGYYTRTFPNPYLTPTKIYTIDNCGYKKINHIAERYLSIRPVISFNNIQSLIQGNKVDEIEYGEYPQFFVNRIMQIILELKYRTGQLTKTGGSYTLNCAYPILYKMLPEELKDDPESSNVKLKEYEEYEYNNQKYIRVRRIQRKHFFTLTNVDYDLDDIPYKDYYEYVWVKVSPVKWLVDLKTNNLVSKYCLLSGIPMYLKPMYLKDNISFLKIESENCFLQSFMAYFLNNYMLQDMTQSIKKTDIYNKKEEKVNAKKKILKVR